MEQMKPTPVHRMKVVPYRPVYSLVRWILFTLLLLGCVLAVRYYTIYDERKTLLSPEESAEILHKLEKLTVENQAYQEQLTHYQVRADVDQQSAESVRQQVLTQQEKIGALERSVAVYRMMLSRDVRNPKGVSYGTFTVTPNEQPNSFNIKLAIQKLTETEGDFEGELRWLIVGRENNKEKKYSLHEVALAKEGEPVFKETIPLSFKIFQKIDVNVVLPQEFVPTRIELQVTSPRRDSTRVDGQLEWPKDPVVTTSSSIPSD